MSSRKAVRKPKKNSLKRVPAKKEKKPPIRKAQEANQAKVEEARKYRLAINQAAVALRKFKAHTEILIEAADSAKKPIDFLRAWYGAVNGPPSLIYCKERNSWTDIVVCEYACPVSAKPCSAYVSRRFICKLLKCDKDHRDKCEDKGIQCYAFKIMTPFVDQYTRAYGPIYKIQKDLEAKKIKIKEKKSTEVHIGKDSLSIIKKERKRKPARTAKRKPQRKAQKNAD